MDPNQGRAVPHIVRRAHAAALEHGFTQSCTDAVGRLLATLAASASGPILELGTGVGVSTAWMSTTARQPIITVERDETTAGIARTVLQELSNVDVVHGVFNDVRSHGPFTFAFVKARMAKGRFMARAA
jgi:predicted O-methyltransferase YrrM